MAQYGEVYTAYEWHMVDPASGRICVYMQNRRDHPSGSGVIDFPGVTILHYAGGGKFDYEEDLWSVPGAQRSTEEYEAARKAHDRDHRKKMTRHDWGRGPEWTLGGRSFAERRPITDLS
jgi:hypothetical protein